MYIICMLYAFICLLYVYYMYIKLVLYAYHIILYVHSMLYYTRCTFNVELSMCMFKSWVEYGAVPKNMAYAVTPLRKRYDHCIFLKMVHCVQMGKNNARSAYNGFLYTGTDFFLGPAPIFCSAYAGVWKKWRRFVCTGADFSTPL